MVSVGVPRLALLPPLRWRWPPLPPPPLLLLLLLLLRLLLLPPPLLLLLAPFHPLRLHETRQLLRLAAVFTIGAPHAVLPY